MPHTFKIKLFMSFTITSVPFSNFFFDQKECLDDAEKNILKSVIPISQFNLFPICSFTAGLKSLWYDFLQIISFYKWDENDFNISKLLTPKDKKKISEIKKLYSNIRLHTPFLVTFPTRWDKNLLSLRLNCENLMHLSIYHLCLLTQSGTLGSGIIKTCPKCHKQFIAKRKNQKFCYNPCTPQANYSQKKRNSILQKGRD